MWPKVSKTKWTWCWYIFRCRWFGIKVHWIRPTEDEWHTHPWNGFSLILGSYEEQKRPGDGSFVDVKNKSGRWRRVWLFNRIRAFIPHRTRGNTLTIFFHGPRVNENWFWGEDKAPWRGPQDA